MLELARPGVFIVGAGIALVPVLLHLIARRPPARAPLPTARFLREDPRTAIHVGRRPVDIVLLALRVLFLLLLALAFAGPTWSAPRRGTVDLVLLDRGRGMAMGWTAAVDSARRLLLAAPRARLIVFDTVATRVPHLAGDEVVLDSLRADGVSRWESDYAAALRTMRDVARDSQTDSARAWLVTLPRWGAWSAGLGLLRAAAWPGSVELVIPDVSGHAPASFPPAVAGPAVALVTAVADTFASAALGAIGYAVLRTAAQPMPDTSARVVLARSDRVNERALAQLIERARAGATVILTGPPPRTDVAESVAWAAGSDAVPASVPVLFDDGTELAALEGAVAIEPRPGTRVIAAGSNGRVAAVADRLGSGCIVHFAGDLFARNVALADGYVRALRRLTDACATAGTRATPDGTDTLPLDSAARALLMGEGLARVVALSTIAPATGRSLMRLFLIAAILVALMETWLAYRGGASR